ncbi:MAG TPA: DUF1761 domain-containing protein [Bacteroidota bacterium]|nr:DUF1761 domain-containing protein [Bacteroidota bacterium]
MASLYYSQLNVWAVVVAAATYWILGSIWFSLLFGKIWSSELEKHGVKIQTPKGSRMAAKLVQTFILNLAAALALSYLVFVSESSTLYHAIKLGLASGVGLSASTIGIAYTWEGRSVKLAVIDIGYPLLGVVVCSIILTLWR